jgi:hypothetical protein
LVHLRRLERASSTAEIVRELESLRPSLSPGWRLSGLALPSLASLAEAHLRERVEPACDPLTGALNAGAFNQLWRSHAGSAHGANDITSVAITLSFSGDPVRDRRAAVQLQILATTCIEAVAANDYVGRIAASTIAVLPRNGGLHGARIVAARLADSCRVAFADANAELCIEIELRDLAGGVSERSSITVGALS